MHWDGHLQPKRGVYLARQLRLIALVATLLVGLGLLAACTRGVLQLAAAPSVPAAPVSLLPTPSSTPARPATPVPTATPIPPRLATLLPAPTPTATATPAPTFAPTPDGTVRSADVPILMYHYVSEPPPGADIYRMDLSVTPELFATHLDRLLAEGYQAITLYDLADYLMLGRPLPPKPVIITFDDGYRDNYANAFPALRARGMPATFFVVTDFIDEQRPEYLSWGMAREMLAAGMSIESHGRNHASLQGRDTDYLVWQALGSLETLAFELGVQPRFVSYPAGEYDQATIDVFHSANYWAGVTTQQGMLQSNAQPFEWSRIRVRNSTTPDKLIQLLEADW